MLIGQARRSPTNAPWSPGSGDHVRRWPTSPSPKASDHSTKGDENPACLGVARAKPTAELGVGG